MAGGSGILDIDYASAEGEILGFIRKIVREADANGVVVGLSGGVDSAVVCALCVKALGKEKVTALIMPSDFTPRVDSEDAAALATQWGVRTYDTNISMTVDQFFSAFDIKGSKIARANVQARVRMTLSYFVANTYGLVVAGTGDRSEDLLGYFCYDSLTRVVTVDGPKGMEDLKRGDTVFSLDPGSMQIVEAKVDDVFRFDYSGRMIHFRGRGVDLLVTPNHRMLVHSSAYHPNSRPVFRTAEDCAKSTHTVVPLPARWSGKPGLPRTITLSFKQRHLKRVVEISVEDAFYLFGLFIGDGYVTKGEAVIPVKSELMRVEYYRQNRDKGGRFTPVASETGGLRMKRYETFETTFALTSYTKEVARQRLTETLTKYGVGFSLTRNTVRVPSRGIYDVFLQFGVGARNKRIPKWILQYPSEVLVHLLRGLKDSDGTHAENQNVYYTSSPRLKDDFVQLCFKLGRRATVRVRGPRASKIGNKAFITGPSYEIRYTRKQRPHHNLTNRNTLNVNYSGTVWCPSVPPFENILVERNGKYIFSGNTKYGDGGVDFLPIAHLYKTQVRRLGARLGLPDKIVNKPASPQLWRGHTAAQELGADYEVLDPLLHYMFDEKLSPSAAAKKAGVGENLANEVLRMSKSSAHKRAYPPMVRPW